MANTLSESPVTAAIRRSKVKKLQLSRELGMGTTTIWRACLGLAIKPEQAKKLCERFPELDFRALTLGAEPASPEKTRKRRVRAS